MNTRFKLLAAVLLTSAASEVTAGTYVLRTDGSLTDAVWTDLFNSYFGERTAPSAGNAYWVDYYRNVDWYGGEYGNTVYVQGMTEDYTFPGTEIKFYNNCNLVFRNEADVVVSLPLNYDYGSATGFGTTHITTWANSRPYHVLAGSITSVYGQNKFVFSLTQDDLARGFEVRSTISGGMSISVSGTSTANGPKRFHLNAVSTDWKGKFSIDGAGGDANILFRLGSNDALPHPDELTSDAVTLSGATWEFAEDQTVDSDVCGITIGVNGLVIDVAEGKRAEIACPVYGAGDIVKKGPGRLVFAPDALANYTGTITLQAGTIGEDLVITGGSTVYVSSKQVSVSHLGFDVTGALITLDLTEASQTVPYLKVNDGMAVNPVYVQFALAGTYGYVPYAVIQAPKASSGGLSDLVAKGRLVFNDPTVADCQVVDNGDGTETLFVVPTDPATVFRKTVGEGDYQSALYNAKWGAGPSAPVAGGTYNFWYTYDCGGNDFLYGLSGTFAGKHLYLNGGEWYGWCNFPCDGNDITIPLATMKRTETDLWGVKTNRFKGDYCLSPYVFYAEDKYPGLSGWIVTSRSTKRLLDLGANLRGTGTFSFIQTGNPAIEAVNALSGDNSNFLGDIRLAGQTNCFVRIADESNLGANPLSFNAAALRFNGLGLCVANSVTLDDPNRGITLDATGGRCLEMRSADDEGSMYGIDDDDPRMTYPGGAWLKAESGTRLAIACPVAGDGGLTLVGDGDVALSGVNTFAGGVTVRTGALVAESPTALGSGPLAVSKGATLFVSAGVGGNGVELAAPVAFEAGARIGLEVPAGTEMRSGLEFPLLLLAAGDSIDLGVLKVNKASLKSYGLTFRLKQQTVNVNDAERTLVSAELCSGSGFVVVIR